MDSERTRTAIDSAEEGVRTRLSRPTILVLIASRSREMLRGSLGSTNEKTTTPIEPIRSKNDVPLDVLFETLSRGPRRRILESLRAENPRSSEEFEDLSFYPEGADDDEVVIQLHHTHLPRLESAGFIDWDGETDTITKGPNFDEIRPLLKLMHDHEAELPDDWP